MDLRAFAKAIIKVSFASANDLDLEDLHGLMVKYGLLIETTFDPEKHSSEWTEVEFGDPWYVVAPELED